MAPLGLLPEGEKAEIIEIRQHVGYCHEKSKTQICHAGEMGLRIGKTVEMLNNRGTGPILLKIDESRIALGRGMAMKIMVKRQ